MKAVLIVAVLAVTASALTRQNYEDQFTSFVSQYNKKYDGVTEFFNRFNIFKAKVDEINLHNAGNFSYTLGINEFSDLTWEEFQSTYLGLKIPDVDNTPVFESDVVPSNDKDWRTLNAVTGVKNQGSCGSCWVFGGVGTIETWSWTQSKGTLNDLSDQQVLDCSKGGSCGGGYPDKTIIWACANPLCKTSDYQYTARQGTCKTSCTPVSSKCSGAKKLTTEDGQAQALEGNPFSIGVYIGSAFQSYKSGVFSGPCGSGGHAMTVVAYDAQTWSVKNSWGNSWGEKGYSRWARGKNLCQFTGYSHVPN